MGGEGKKVFIDNEVSLINCKVGEYSNYAHHAEVWNSVIGKRTSIGRYTKVKLADIGSYCAISWEVTIGADAHPTDRVTGSAAFFQRRFGLVEDDISKGEVPRTKIGNDVLIGCKAIIISGVTIGDGAIIGAGAVVTKDVEPYAIVVGIPARCIGYRFSEDVRKNLLEAEWWSWRDDVLKENIELFQQSLSEELSEKILNISKQDF